MHAQPYLYVHIHTHTQTRIYGSAEKFAYLPHSYHYNGHDHLYPGIHEEGSGAGIPSRHELVQGVYIHTWTCIID